MNLRAIWRAFVLFGIFFVLLIAGWHELPGGESLLSWYVIIASVAAALGWSELPQRSNRGPKPVQVARTR